MGDRVPDRNLPPEGRNQLGHASVQHGCQLIRVAADRPAGGVRLASLVHILFCRPDEGQHAAYRGLGILGGPQHPVRHALLVAHIYDGSRVTGPHRALGRACPEIIPDTT